MTMHDLPDATHEFGALMSIPELQAEIARLRKSDSVYRDEIVPDMERRIEEAESGMCEIRAGAKRDRNAYLDEMQELRREKDAQHKAAIFLQQKLDAMTDQRDAANSRMGRLEEALRTPFCDRCDDSGTVTVHLHRSQELSTQICPVCHGVAYAVRHRIAALTDVPAECAGEGE